MYYTSILKYAGIFVLLIVLQVTLIGYLLSVPNYNITPDLVILYVIYIGYSQGNVPGMISGFLSGLVLDILSGSFIGLLCLSYSIAGFVAGYFNRQLNSGSSKRSSFIGIIFMCTLIAYTIYYVIYFQGSSINFFDIFIKHVMTTTIYTSVFGLIFALIYNRFDIKKTF